MSGVFSGQSCVPLPPGFPFIHPSISSFSVHSSSSISGFSFFPPPPRFPAPVSVLNLSVAPLPFIALVPLQLYFFLLFIHFIPFPLSLLAMTSDVVFPLNSLDSVDSDPASLPPHALPPFSSIMDSEVQPSSSFQ